MHTHTHTHTHHLYEADHLVWFVIHTGKSIIPIPVYFPDATEILGKPVKRLVSEVQGMYSTTPIYFVIGMSIRQHKCRSSIKSSRNSEAGERRAAAKERTRRETMSRLQCSEFECHKPLNPHFFSILCGGVLQHPVLKWLLLIIGCGEWFPLPAYFFFLFTRCLTLQSPLTFSTFSGNQVTCPVTSLTFWTHNTVLRACGSKQVCLGAWHSEVRSAPVHCCFPGPSCRNSDILTIFPTRFAKARCPWHYHMHRDYAPRVWGEDDFGGHQSGGRPVFDGWSQQCLTLCMSRKGRKKIAQAVKTISHIVVKCCRIKGKWKFTGIKKSLPTLLFKEEEPLWYRVQ